ncbi:fatty acid synthase-like protein [Myxozyma melibiosi]|uniref:Fatty acid synthase subunit alpha n=1 Tax=Myxozyma melibiosi TaxID=54550 RepID=A0ABR1F455_9ASCO
MHPETEQELAHILLIELLAYQFASPVRWIETQDVIFQEFNAERVVEIGPSPTLAGMASRTLKAKYESYDAALSLQRQVLCYSKDTKEIYYTADPAPEEPAAPAASTSAPAAAAPAAAAAAPAAAAPAAAAPVAAASAVADEPVKAVDIVRAIVAQKLKKPFDQIPLSKTIKDLVGGKSTLQNEILGDLGKEFGAAPDKAEETPIDELGAAIQASGFNGQLGKQSASLASRLIASKMPGGFNMTTARKYLQDRWGLAAGRQDSALLLAVTVEPPARLAAEPDAKKYLDEIAQKYASLNGISLASAAADAGAGAAAGGAIAIDSAAFDALTKDQTTLVRQQMELFAKYLKVDLRAGDKLFIDEQDATSELRKELDLWQAEHGDFYASGIAPTFSPLKARVYDSSWNWARQDALSMFYDIIFGRLSVVDREIVSRCILLMNRSNPTLLEFMQYHIDHCPEDRGETYELAKKLGQMLIDNCRDALEVDPVYKDVMYPTAPETTIDLKGNINYDEVPRTAVRKLEQYVKEMASGGKITENGNRTKLHSDLSRIYKIIRRQQKVSKSSKLQIKNLYDEVIRSLSLETAAANNETSPNGRQSSPKRGKRGSRKKYTETIPFLHLKQKDSQGQGWEYSKSLTGIYLECLEQAAKSGITFKNKYALMTGVGAGSIGAAVLQGLLSGGAKVIVTTSRYSKEVTEYYQAIYAKYGASNSTLIVVPFNQGSKQDVDALVEYIYDSKKGLGWDLDFIVPFAAIPENGREIDNIDSRSELAHRIMLTNLLRILGAVKVQKANRGYETRPAQVVLPMSPNHGTFGSDGLYSESKLALETLFNRWFSESWGSYLTVCGAVIGWTRGTGLMNQNNLIAERIENLGVRTFSQQEMAFNILGLMSPAIVNLCQIEPVFADLNGGMQYIPNLKDMSSQIRQELMQTSEIRRAVSSENAIEYKLVNGAEAERLHKQVVIQPRANIKFEFPELKPFSDFEPLAKDLHGMVDLEKVCVITGFAEVGPWGNSRTRWEMEAHGQFSLEGCIEMAWIMGLIKHHHGQLKGKMYSGWVDTKTNEPVDDFDVKSKYEKHILEHSGIRLIEPELFNNYDPNKKKMYQEVVIEQDLEPFETSKETALEFKRENGDKVEIFEISETGQWTVRFLKGASMMLPKALQFDRLVAGQIPTGWNAKTYGISDDIISQVDPITLYVLVSTVEALLSSGITDPYEFYKYVHVSEVGNCTGSGVGGQSALRGMYRDRFLDKPVQKDILQESFVNTMSAWVNMLLLSSSGPIKTPVGACATAIESVDIGYETIMSGKAKICLVGGYDDFQEEGSYEFGNMGATSNSEEEIKHGRTPAEMSRPATTTRAGFMESQGSGIQVMMTAKLAIDMGVPIYGIVGMTATATDKIGRSVPAPGKGILTTARENVESKFPSPLLDIKYRRRQLEKRKAQIREWTESEILQLQEEVEAMRSQYAEFDEKAYLAERIEHLEREASRQEKDALAMWGNEFYRKDARISPIRGALAVWNLSVDDLGVASFHGTSTMANDKNESMTLANMMTHLGRSKGNALLGIFQKYLTGHPKGAAGAWMLNGALQVLNTGLVPGNRNADNIDKNLEQFDSILYPSRSIQTDGIKAASVTSFGFGQKGAQAIVIKSDYLFATLDESVYNAYAAKVTARHKKAYGYIHNAMATNTMFVAKTDPPYNKEQEATVYLDPLVRVEPSKDTYAYPTKPVKKVVDPSKQQTEDVLLKLTQSTAAAGTNVGVDVEAFDAIPLSNETFIERNYTDSEIAYCRASPDPTASFTGTWCAKEAVFKSLGVKSDGAGAALKEIEIVRKAGKPEVVLSGQAKTKADASGVKGVSVSISHNEFQAVAVAVADVA